MGEDQSLLRHGSGIVSCVKFFMQDFNLCSELGSFLIELMEAGDLPSQPPVVKVTDVTLQVHEVTAGPNEEGAEPGRERFDGVFLPIPNSVSLRIQVDNVRGLIRALLLVESGNPSVFQLLEPLGQFEDSIPKGNVQVGHPRIVLDVPVGGLLKYVFIVLDVVVEPTDLFFKMVDFTGFLGIALSDGGEEPFSDGLEDVRIEIRVGHQGGCNVPGNIGGSGLLTGLTRRGMWFPVGEVFERLIEPFEDI